MIVPLSEPKDDAICSGYLDSFALRCLESAHDTSCPVFSLLLIIAKTDRPSIMPRMIDSHEKAGIGVVIIGVEAEFEVVENISRLEVVAEVTAFEVAYAAAARTCSFVLSA